MNDLSIDQDDEEAALWVARQLGGPVDVAAIFGMAERRARS